MKNSVSEIRELMEKLKNFSLILEKKDEMGVFVDNALENLLKKENFKKLSSVDKALLMSASNDPKISNLSLIDVIRGVNELGERGNRITIKVKVIKTSTGFENFKDKIGWVINPKIRVLLGSTDNKPFVRVQFNEFDNETSGLGGGSFLNTVFPVEDLELKGVEIIKSDFDEHMKRIRKDNELLNNGGYDF